jgi:uncharacterized protein (DUF952 family)
MSLIFKIIESAAWQTACREGVFRGAEVDLADGYIHFSTSDQLAETAEKHFRGRDGLMLVAVDEARLGEALKYEASRGGKLFPHLYGALDPSIVAWAKLLRRDETGRHVLP